MLLATLPNAVRVILRERLGDFSITWFPLVSLSGVYQDQSSSLGFCMNTTADLCPSGA